MSRYLIEFPEGSDPFQEEKYVVYCAMSIQTHIILLPLHITHAQTHKKLNKSIQAHMHMHTHTRTIHVCDVWRKRGLGASDSEENNAYSQTNDANSFIIRVT